MSLLHGLTRLMLTRFILPLLILTALPTTTGTLAMVIQDQALVYLTYTQRRVSIMYAAMYIYRAQHVWTHLAMTSQR